MKILNEIKRITLTIIFSILVILTAKAAEPYKVSEVEIDESEFPRIQGTLSIEGDNKNLRPKNLSIIENNDLNENPMALLPPHQKPEKIDLHVLIDTSIKTNNWKEMIQSNLKGLINYLEKENMDVELIISSFRNEESIKTKSLNQSLEAIDSIEFESESKKPTDGFSRITDFSEIEKRQGSQKVILIFNGSNHEDDRPDGVTGKKMQAAIKAVNTQADLTFIMGHPFQKIHQPRTEKPSVVLADFSHSIKGGYLGGIASDLSSLGDLLIKQSDDHFVFQYYSEKRPHEFLNTPVKLSIDRQAAYQFNYKTPISNKLEINHIPDNEINIDNLNDFTIQVKNHQKAVNVSLINYLNEEGLFDGLPMTHQRAESTKEQLKFSTDLKEELLKKDMLSYYISIHTSYSSEDFETGLISLPIRIYDDGILLEAKKMGEESVEWTWSGPTVEKGVNFELWSGDDLITTTSEKSFINSLNKCNRYQIFQVVVIFEDLKIKAKVTLLALTSFMLILMKNSPQFLKKKPLS